MHNKQAQILCIMTAKKSLKKFAKGIDNRQEKRYTILVPRGTG